MPTVPAQGAAQKLQNLSFTVGDKSRPCQVESWCSAENDSESRRQPITGCNVLHERVESNRSAGENFKKGSGRPDSD